jgi:hypothetical protein
MMRRVTLEGRETRIAQMRQHVRSVAEAVLNDTTGDAVFGSVLRLHRHVHRYSLRNTLLIRWQAPDSGLVASRTAFSRMAADTGHRPRSRTSRRGRSWQEHVYVAAGSRAVWVWGDPRTVTVTREREEAESGETASVPFTYTTFRPVDLYQIEDIRCCDDERPLALPSFSQPVDDPDLFAALAAFAGSRGITVSQEGLHGAAGVSRLGSIALQRGDPFSLHVAPLVHELAHELLHGERERRKLPREVMEAEAECVTGVVMNLHGHPVGLSASYLRHWCRGGETAHEVVLDSMDRIARAAAEIVDFVEGRVAGTVGAAEAAPTGRPLRVA